ncbi:MAG TPA: OB-fold nucleic acid binding domain-containing protein [Stellaceae bacterium]|nr:OB-fold nucleic acid binding domain-containing protein [Stellaceae bacterium]
MGRVTKIDLSADAFALELGSVEGHTEQVEREGKGCCVLYLTDRLRDASIKCVLTGAALAKADQLDAGARVRVFGKIYYRGQHSRGPRQISWIEATDIAFPPPRSTLPTIDDVIDETFTGGLRSEEYLEKLRNGGLA